MVKNNVEGRWGFTVLKKEGIGCVMVEGGGEVSFYIEGEQEVSWIL